MAETTLFLPEFLKSALSPKNTLSTKNIPACPHIPITTTTPTTTCPQYHLAPPQMLSHAARPLLFFPPARVPFHSTPRHARAPEQHPSQIKEKKSTARQRPAIRPGVHALSPAACIIRDRSPPTGDADVAAEPTHAPFPRTSLGASRLHGPGRHLLLLFIHFLFFF